MLDVFKHQHMCAICFPVLFISWPSFVSSIHDFVDGLCWGTIAFYNIDFFYTKIHFVVHFYGVALSLCQRHSVWFFWVKLYIWPYWAIWPLVFTTQLLQHVIWVYLLCVVYYMVRSCWILVCVRQLFLKCFLDQTWCSIVIFKHAKGAIAALFPNCREVHHLHDADKYTLYSRGHHV